MAVTRKHSRQALSLSLSLGILAGQYAVNPESGFAATLAPVPAGHQGGAASHSNGSVNAGRMPALPGVMNLDLSSKNRSVVAGSLPGFQNTSIQMNGVTRAVNPAAMLTPAQAVAVMQNLSTGHQSLLLGS